MKNHILLIVTILLFVNDSYAQCCSAGNPFFYGEISNINKNNLQFVLGYKYSTSNKYYEGSNPIEIEFIDKAYFNYMTLQTYYGITQRLSVQADLGYFINKTETYLVDDWSKSNGYGIGDATLSIKYLAYNNYKKHFKLIPSIGITLPIGVFDQEKDHVKLPITVQPSSGSFKYQASLYANKTTINKKFNFTAFALFEYAQLIDSKNFYYKYGNQFLISFLTSYKVGEKLSFALELRNENRGKSIRNDDQVVDASGFNIIYIIPHISYSFSKNWYLALNSDMPIYKYYNGIQMSNTYSVSMRLSYSINL